MTRLALLADIHGNLPAFEAALDAIAHEGVDAIVIAGDLINLAPFSAEVLTRAFAEGCLIIRGNHEFYLLDANTEREPAAWRDYTTPRWLRATIPLDLQRRVAALPDTLSLRYPDAPPLRIAHGWPRTPWDGMYPSTPDAETAAELADMEEDTLVIGHIHLPQERWIVSGGRLRHIINPGAVGLTLDAQPGTAPYAILEGDRDGWRVTRRRAPFDHARLIAALDDPAYTAAHGPFARLFRAEFEQARLFTWPFHRWRAACRPDAPIDEALVDAFFALGADGMRTWVVDDFVAYAG